ncbi:hypothetical protein QVD17_02426 [Tagetes erecta]|uniref:BHLH domain-containing protein n=1 Tax=Tagetes erecta TaxID=13708 RepID=A0AAD8L9D0_TARER|nr:hypothetical protein QVD17_02426 [Tagetes erecta]
MESYANFFSDEWHSLGRMFSSHNEAGFDQFADIFMSVSDESTNVESFEHFVNASDDVNSSFYHLFANENNTSISNSDHASNDTNSLSYAYRDSFPFSPSNVVLPLPIDVCDQSLKYHMMNEINNSSHVYSNGSEWKQDVAAEKVRMGNPIVSSGETTLKRKHETRDLLVNNQKTDKNHKKRVSVLFNLCCGNVKSIVYKTKTNVQSKRNQQMNETENGNNNQVERNGQSSSSCSSNDDCDGSQDLNGACNQNGKTRATRGTATDPQSLYARKRRERINERLKILQTLVPNGTKVDISTMLEEAVEYVKFLKLQIQLLSSDDMWMYAPIAYNGMNMGLYQNITQSL